MRTGNKNKERRYFILLLDDSKVLIVFMGIKVVSGDLLRHKFSLFTFKDINSGFWYPYLRHYPCQSNLRRTFSSVVRKTETSWTVLIGFSIILVSEVISSIL